MQSQKDDCNKWNRSSIKARQQIREWTKPSTDKTSGHDSSIFIGNHLLILMISISCYF